jgi:hypothetical protein
MNDRHNLPSAFERVKEIKKLIQNAETTKTLNRFQYRYRMARAFEGINAPDVGDRTVRGYAAGMKVLLAYGAFDEIRQVKNDLPIRPLRGEYVKIFDEKLAGKLRKNLELQRMLAIPSAVSNAALKRDIKSFFDAENNDVMCIATGLRNAFAHGVFTAAGAGLTTKKRQLEITELANCLLDRTDSIAMECVEQLERDLRLYKKQKV